MISDTAKHSFRETVWEYFRANGRHDLPWRQPDTDGSYDPYKILVSEIMLQQTQVSRVVPKYKEFIERFPTTSDLATAELGDVLRVWSGLGYNRRAKYLHQAAVLIDKDRLPVTAGGLVKLPGVGQNTAGAVLAYAFNQPTLFVETNIRTVFIHHFFADQEGVHDKDILELVAETIDTEHPRQWYWGLMDYGSALKQTVGNQNHLSKHYTKQSKFEGSKRQVRGYVLRSLAQKTQTLEELKNGAGDDRLESVIDDLLKEGLIKKDHRRLSL